VEDVADLLGISRPTGAAARHLAPVKRGLKRGLRDRARSVLLMLDETIVTETPPLYAAYGHRGQQVRVPITGNRAQRILHGALNIHSGDGLVGISEEGTPETHQGLRSLIRPHWRGRHGR